ncbi:unnamed protein product [Lymnaea stagnalis]|uniref:Peroxisomal membrane protein 11C n=1 Tax=Lymnaea stagnalis TaxID=6523 RepID=A0AAV2H4P9_LYMST
MPLIKDSLTTLMSLLETYRGRDRIIRLLTYAAMYMGGDGKTPVQVKWRIVSSEMSGCRVILRLFDDLSMLLYNLSSNFGFKEKGVLKPLEVFIAICNQLYYPSEHISWLRQKNILNGTPTVFSLFGLLFWTLALFGEIIKSIIKIRLLNTQAKNLIKQQQLDKDSFDYSSAQNAQIKESLKKLSAERKDLLLLLIQYGSDFTNAISWFPPGILWAQKLKPSYNGILGMIASFIMLYRNWPSKT